MHCLVSIIIPTHNRRETLLRHLHAFAKQTYPHALMELIVVANACNDGTVDALRCFEIDLPLTICELAEGSAALARNEGARVASGSILIFLDDDVEPSPSLVEAHVAAHANGSNQVVIGYLPPVVYGENSIFRAKVREWWEQAFDEMRRSSHCYHYQNLTSGNFSITKKLFLDTGCFNPVFTCQEDYELGLRLIQNGAQFSFEEKAMGFHHENADLEKAFFRKYQEGKAAVNFWKLYPQIIQTSPLLRNLTAKTSRFRTLLIFCLFHLPQLAGVYANYLRLNMYLAQRLRRRKAWQLNVRKLMLFYSLCGAVDTVRTKETLKTLVINSKTATAEEENSLIIDLKDGLAEAEKKVDEIRPACICIYFGNTFIGALKQQFGYERWRGPHLRKALATQFGWELINAVAVNRTEQLQHAATGFDVSSREKTYENKFA